MIRPTSRKNVLRAIALAAALVAASTAVATASSVDAGLCKGGKFARHDPRPEARQKAQKAIEVLDTLRQSSPDTACKLMMICADLPDLPLELADRPLAAAKIYPDEVKGLTVEQLLAWINPSRQFVFPIYAEENDREGLVSSVTVTKRGPRTGDSKEWDITSIGRQQLVSTLFQEWAGTMVREGWEQTKNSQIVIEGFLIEVPHLYRLYLATCQGEDLMVRSVFGDKPVKVGHHTNRLEEESEEFWKAYFEVFVDLSAQSKSSDELEKSIDEHYDARLRKKLGLLTLEELIRELKKLQVAHDDGLRR